MMPLVSDVKQKLPGHMRTSFHYFRYIRSDRRKLRHLRLQSRPLGYDRIYFYHIRKTAGTSLGNAFLRLGGQDFTSTAKQNHYDRNGWLIHGDHVYVTHNKYLLQRGRYFYGDSHFSAHELRIPRNTFTITILRDPAARVISHYKMLRHWRDHGVQHPGKTRRENDPGKNFLDFLDKVPRAHLMRQLFMFSRTFSIDEAVSRLSKLNFIMRTETFGSDLRRLGSVLDLDLRPYSEKAGYGEVSISDAERARLHELLAPEYAMIEAVSPLVGLYREVR